MGIVGSWCLNGKCPVSIAGYLYFVATVFFLCSDFERSILYVYGDGGGSLCIALGQTYLKVLSVTGCGHIFADTDTCNLTQLGREFAAQPYVVKVKLVVAVHIGTGTFPILGGEHTDVSLFLSADRQTDLCVLPTVVAGACQIGVANNCPGLSVCRPGDGIILISAIVTGGFQFQFHILGIAFGADLYLEIVIGVLVAVCQPVREVYRLVAISEAFAAFLWCGNR